MSQIDQIKFVNFLLEWFKDNKRDFPWRNETDPYRILIAEKMLQQTTYGHVLRVYYKFLETYPNIYTLSNANIDEVENIIRPLGFHRQRSKQFIDIAKMIVRYYEGKVPQEHNDLLKLNGVGEYIANAILCFAFKKDVPIIDVNVRRVLLRVLNWNLNDKVLYEKLNRIIPIGSYHDFNLAIIDFSTLICSRKPKCKKCQLINICHYYSRNY